MTIKKSVCTGCKDYFLPDEMMGKRCLFCYHRAPTDYVSPNSTDIARTKVVLDPELFQRFIWAGR